MEPVNVNGGLIGIPLSAGDCTVTLTYSPPYLIPGIAVSAVSLVVLLAACLLPGRKRKKKKPLE